MCRTEVQSRGFRIDIVIQLQTTDFSLEFLLIYFLNLVSRSIIFTQDSDEARLAGLSKQREQSRLADQRVLTSINPLAIFYPAEAEHQVLCSNYHLTE